MLGGVLLIICGLFWCVVAGYAGYTTDGSRLTAEVCALRTGIGLLFIWLGSIAIEAELLKRRVKKLEEKFKAAERQEKRED